MGDTIGGAGAGVAVNAADNIPEHPVGGDWIKSTANVVAPLVGAIGANTAQSVADNLRDAGLLHDGDAAAPLFLATDAPDRFSRVGEIFLGAPIDPGQVKLIDL